MEASGLASSVQSMLLALCKKALACSTRAFLDILVGHSFLSLHVYSRMRTMLPTPRRRDATGRARRMTHEKLETRNGKRETKNGKRETAGEKRETGNGRREKGNWKSALLGHRSKSFLPPSVHLHLFNWACDSTSMASGKQLSFNNDGTVFLFMYCDNSNIYVSLCG